MKSGGSETILVNKFIQLLEKIGRLPICAQTIDTLQVNLGYRCNLACKHCHVQAGPNRTEMMSRDDIESVIQVLGNSPIGVLDLTGGAPELHPDFRFLVTTARAIGCHVIARSNLAIFFEDQQEDLPAFYSENGVEIVASLPCFSASNVDIVRGDGIFKKSIEALQILNDHRYGDADGKLKINLVYNPTGAFLPPPQESLEELYRKELLENFGVRFNSLYTIANMPLGRFKDFLIKTDGYDNYLEGLQKAFNPETLENLMCRQLISVGWDGTLADCDFNYVAGTKVENGFPAHIRDFDYEVLCRRQIVLNEHCFGCTAGQGST